MGPALAGAGVRPVRRSIDVDKASCGAQSAAATRGWETVALSSAPATLRLPKEAYGHAEMATFQDNWLTQEWEVRVDVSRDSTGAPFAVVGGLLPPARSDSVACIDTVAGRPMHIVTYRQPSGELRGEYVVVADWPLAAGGWLRIGGVARDTGGQHLLQAVVQTLALTDSATASKLYHPNSRCEVTDRYYSSWSTRRLRYAAVKLLVPRDMRSNFSKLSPEEVLGWSKGGGSIVLMYRVLHTSGWQLSKPAGSAATWCQMLVAGRRLEFAADSVTPEFHYPIMKARAYLELSPGVVLAVESHLRGDVPDGLEQLLAVLASMEPAQP